MSKLEKFWYDGQDDISTMEMQNIKIFKKKKIKKIINFLGE